MKRNVIGKNGRHIIGWLSKTWNTNPWVSADRLGADHGADQRYWIYGAEQASRSLVRVPDSGTPTSGQLAALNTWEDDGGRTIVPAKAIGIEEETAFGSTTTRGD